MPRPSEGPKSPTPEEIEVFVDTINDEIGRLETGEYTMPNRIAVYQRLIEVLDWAEEQVNKRRLYSKKFQLKDRERTRMLKERLGEQYEEIIEQATKRAEAGLFQEVANNGKSELKSLYAKE